MKNVPIKLGYSTGKSAGLLAALTLATSVPLLQGASIDWSNTGSGEYNVPDNWSTSAVPGSGDVVIVNNGGTVQVSGTTPNWALSGIRLGNNADTSGSFELTSGTVSTGSEIHVGASGTGTLTMSGGTLNSSGWLHLGLTTSDSSGTFNLSGGLVNIANHVTVGRRGIGNMTMTGGTLNFRAASGGNFVLGDRSLAGFDTSFGTLTHSAGTIQGYLFAVGSGVQATNRTKSGQYNISGSAVLNVDEFLIGRNGGSGEVTMTGGEINIKGYNNPSNAGFFAIGHSNGGNGILNQSGGTINKLTGETYLGRLASAGAGVTGSWTLSGTAVANLDDLVISQGSASLATLNLNGGTISVTQFRTNGGTSIINLNGGRIVARTPNSSYNFMQGLTAVNVQAGGVTFDTNGNDIVIAQNLVDDGGGSVTKTGLGSMTFTGRNTYLGDTIVEEGTFILADGGSMVFGIGEDGINNMITGTGSVDLSGMFIFDLDYASYSMTILDSSFNGVSSWTIVDSLLGVSYGDTFSILGFTDIGLGIWSYVDGAINYTYDESTGVLTGMVPEPGHYALFVALMMVGAVIIRRRMKQ